MIPELELYRHYQFPLLYWLRVGDDPQEWKGPHETGWNDPSRVYDVSKFDPSIHNLGTFTGREAAPRKYPVDVDFDKFNQCFADAFFPKSLGVTRPGKPLSHLLYMTAKPLKGRLQYKSFSDDKPYIELRGSGCQTMLPPSLHTPPDVRVSLVEHELRDADLSALEAATLDYAIASLVAEAFPRGLHHDERMALAGCLLKRRIDEGRVAKILHAVCTYQVECRIPDMSRYDIDDARKLVNGTALRLKESKPATGSTHLREINPDFVKRLLSWLPKPDGVKLEDFYAFMPSHSYFFMPSREFWPASSVNARIAPIPNGTDEKGKEKTVPANVWLDWTRPVEQMVWAPGLPPIIADKLVAEGGWIEHKGCSCINAYLPPQIEHGDAAKAKPWLALVHHVYPEDAEHLIAWFAHRVQRPGEKINHAIVLGGIPGIGKDTILEPVKSAVGPWNFQEVSPKQMTERFNGFVKSVILRISEARDLGEFSRYSFYEHMKTYTAAPPDVLRCDEKQIREYAVFNVCGVVYTTNHDVSGIYLPADDRRHYVAWSPLTEALPEKFWQDIYGWYEREGRRHVAAYLASYDLSLFNPKAPPKKTEAFWRIVDSDRPVEEAELADVVERLNSPGAVTLSLITGCCDEALSKWLQDPKNARQVPHRMKSAGYVPHRNTAAKDGMWKVDGKRRVVYVRMELNPLDRDAAVKELIQKCEDDPASESNLKRKVESIDM